MQANRGNYALKSGIMLNVFRIEFEKTPSLSHGKRVKRCCHKLYTKVHFWPLKIGCDFILAP
jgi:retron-type reverse transcriptase